MGYNEDELLHGVNVCEAVNVCIAWMGYDMDCYMDADGCGLLHIRVTDIALLFVCYNSLSVLIQI